MQNEHGIYRALRDMGLSPDAAAGVEGNLYQESKGDPHSYNPVGGGLFGLENQYGGSPSGGTLNSELQKLRVFITQKGSISDVNAHAGTPGEAAVHFVSQYEGAGIPATAIRVQAANHFAQEEGTS